MARLLFSLLLIISCTGVQAQQANGEILTTQNGFTANSFTALLQDSRGFLWAGTSDGLNRYDGLLVKKYNTYGAGGLTDAHITCLAEDKKGNIWVGTEFGLNKINPFTENITRYFEGTGPGSIPFKWCNRLYIDRKGRIWLTTEKGIARYEEQTNRFHNTHIKLYNNDPKINQFIFGVFEDKQGTLWLAASNGVHHFNPENNTVRSFAFPGNDKDVLRRNTQLCIYEEDETHFLIGTWGGGLVRFNRTTGSFSPCALEGRTDSPVIFDILAAQPGNGKKCWLATSSGVLLAEKNNETGYRVLLPASETAGFIPRSESFRLLYDRQQNLWMSSSSGLYKLSPENNAIQWLSLPENKTIQVAHLVPDPRLPGERFFITTLNGWYTFSYSNQSITPFPLPLNGRQLMSEINDWEYDEQGIWFTSMQGMGYYNFNTKQLYDYSDIIIKASGQPVAGRMAKDAKGRLWIAMRRSGMLVFDPASKTAIPVFHEPGAKQSFFGQDIRDVQAGPNGYIYITVTRLCRVHPETFAMTETFPPDNREDVDVRQISPEKICINPAGRMLVTSRRKIFEYVNGRLEPRFPQQGSSDFELYKLYTADNERYYALTSKGLFITDATLRRWKPIPLAADENGNFPGEITIRQPGSVLVPETGRLGVVNEAALPQPQNAPGILFSRIKLGKNEYFLYGEPGNRLRTSFKNAVEIELSACNFLSENETRIMYRLQGWDEEWKTVTNSPIVRYEQLPPGRYRFMAKTVNSEGEESAETVLRFTIVPPFYRAWWFILLCAIAVSAIFFIFYRYRLRKALELEKLRTRIATDLHDDLGATLSSISMYSETLKNQVKEKLPHLEPVLKRMGENSREMVAGISDIVWAINPGNDDGERLLQRMENYAADTCGAKQVQLHFTATEKIKQVQFALETRKNIYLVFKEAVNNAVKYAGAAQIWVNLALQGKELALEVKDDGCGFDTNTVAKGNGLKNMQLRAKEIKGTILLESAPGSGTRILLKCTV